MIRDTNDDMKGDRAVRGLWNCSRTRCTEQMLDFYSTLF